MSKTFTSIIVIVSFFFIYSAKLSGRDVESHQLLSKSNLGIESYHDNKEQGNIMSYLEDDTSSFNEEVYKLFEKALNKDDFSLRRFLEKNKINLHENISEFAKALENSSKVGSLYLWKSGIDDNDVIAISKALKGKKNIKYIYFSENNIGFLGAAALADLLKDNENNISTFDISNNQIGDTGVQLLSEAFEKHLNITEINFAKNNITNNSASQIRHLIVSNKNIIDIDLGRNLFDYEGACSMINAFENLNERRIDLTLCRNNISEEDYEKISKMVDKIDFNRRYIRVFLRC